MADACKNTGPITARRSPMEGLLKFNLLLVALLLLLNLSTFIVRLVIGTIIIDDAIDARDFSVDIAGFSQLSPVEQLRFYPTLLAGLPGKLLGPGNRASPDFRQANIIAAAVGVAACLVGILHLIRPRDYSRCTVSASNLIALSLNAVALGLAIKQISVGGEIPPKLKALSWISVIQVLPIMLYELLLHASWVNHWEVYHEEAGYAASDGATSIHAGGPPKVLHANP
eukprot:TRINITY_DN60_c0_g1_i2.p1 TRINITY_DN60_c0_g1~~TRINITY_DN60_c0_g1_i2.p1  ORF type:complete len:227 (-),score=21.93 TRINITY_DN60_c0_g1_i2:857-1537(-)